MTRTVPQVLFGIAVVLVGVYLLLRASHVLPPMLEFGWAAVFVIFGGAWVIANASTGRGAIVPGAWAFLYGVYLFAERWEFIPDFRGMLAVPILATLACAFLLAALLQRGSFGSLIAAAALGFASFFVYASHVDPVYAHRIWWDIGRYWPVLLVLMGLSMIIKSFATRRN